MSFWWMVRLSLKLLHHGLVSECSSCFKSCSHAFQCVRFLLVGCRMWSTQQVECCCESHLVIMLVQLRRLVHRPHYLMQLLKYEVLEVPTWDYMNYCNIYAVHALPGVRRRRCCITACVWPSQRSLGTCTRQVFSHFYWLSGKSCKAHWSASTGPNELPDLLISSKACIT